MRRGGPKVALNFRRDQQENEENEKNDQAPAEVEANRYRLEEGEGSSHAQKIVRELYFRYEKQLQRWRDYRNLFSFLGFVALFLAVLYLQRSANVAYKVHSTLADVLVPSDDVMKSTDDVYSWLQSTLNAVWVDPVCGDGICESPWEFASYSRFGCRADCGKLQDIQNLTKIQIDIYWDFSHPVGSMAASDLMSQAKWNLAPLSTSYSGQSYYDTDQTFDRLSGSASFPISDAPDGVWDLTIKRDIFNKIQAAVRDTTMLYAVSYYYKIFIAAASVEAEQNFEINLLQQASVLGNTSYWTYVNNTLKAMYPTNATRAKFEFDQLVNATCGCDNVPVTVGNTTTWGTTVFNALNNTNDYFDSGNLFSISDVATYKSKYCNAFVPGWPSTPDFWEINTVNISLNNGSYIGPVPASWVAGVNYTANVNITVKTSTPLSNVNFCTRVLNNTINWRTNMTTTVQRLMIDKRTGTTGKIVARTTVFNALRDYLYANLPELGVPVFTTPRGTVYADPLNARVDILQEFYIKGPTYQVQTEVANLNISRTKNIYVPNVTLPSMATRAVARIYEVLFQQADLNNSVLVPPPLANKYPNMTVGGVLNAFYAAGATNATLPDANNTAMGSVQTNYNLVVAKGNTTAYMVCSLDSRGSEYLGTCQPMNASCTATTNDTAPYNCTTFATNTTIAGNISNSDYYYGCTLPCDHYFDCSQVCECYGACNSTQVCQCDACNSMGSYNAIYDSPFLDITSQVQNASQLALIPGLSNAAANNAIGRRRLLQSSPPPDISSQLTQVLTQVGSVKTQQDTISAQMTKLQSQVDRANTLAEARANDQRLLDLISAGRQDIKTGQASVEAKLDEIIGKQNQSLAAAEAAAKALDAIQGLAQKQLAAQQALDRAVNNQLAAIKTATYQGIITVTQALALWKRSRRDKALTLKAAKLANVPCTTTPAVDNPFSLDNGNIVDTTTPRERNVGLTNRVIAGMLLHQYRTNDTNCTDSKFSKIQQTCTGPTTLKSYGVDPVFKRGTDLYNPDFDDSDGVLVLNFYNCSLLDSPTYNITFQNTTVNPEPYCAELYNSQRLPYAFHHFPLDGKTNGFPVYFDINLGADASDGFYQFLNEGLYLDMHTRAMTAELVTYNAPLRIFGYFYVEFYFHEGGSIKVTHRLHTVRVELYNGYDDDVRYALEIILTMCISGMLLWTLGQIAWTQKEKKNFLKYFLKSWNVVDFISNALLMSCMIIWWIFVTKYAKTFDILLRYEVYQDLAPDANYLALTNNGQGLSDAWGAINSLRDLIDMLNWYFALNGINILLLIARVLKLMDFQPRLGVVTRSLWLAGPDLIHFAIVAGMVFVGYAMMAHLIFGNAIEKFATFGDAVNTCFEILLGNIDVNEDLRALGGLQSVAGALFFWSYELLVYMVLLNFLLAIIVDAFSEVKEKTHETVGIHTELYQLMRDKWRSLMGRCSSNYISDAKLGQLLKQWAGEDNDEDANQAAGEVSKLLTVLNEDLDEEDLKTILMECLKDAPGGGGEDEDAKTDKAKAASILARCLPSNKRVLATPHEVAQAAKYIVDRFGVPVEAEEQGPGEIGPEQQEGPGVLQDAALEKERDQLAQALERLAEVQRELAEGQRNLMVGQKQLAEQQAKLVTLMAADTKDD